MALRLLAHVDLDGQGFEKGLHKIGESAAHHLKGFVTAAFGVYAIEEAIHKTVETAEELVNASKRLDVTVEQLQTLRQAAKDAGTDMESLAGALEKIDVARDKALGGDKDAIAAFARLGVNQDQLRSKRAADLFTGPISATVKGTNVETITGPLKEIFGRSFGKVVPALKTDFQELQAKLESFGLVMDTSTAVKLKAIGDQFGLLSQIMVVALGPALVQFTDWLIDIFTNSKIIEGIDFLIRKTSALAKLPDYTTPKGEKYSADKIKVIALAAEGQMYRAMDAHETFEQYRAGRETTGTYYHGVNVPGIFNDPDVKSFKDQLHYFSGLIQPAQDAIIDAGKAAGGDMAAMRAAVEDFRKKIQAQIDDLNKPPHFDKSDHPADKKTKHGGRADQADALVRVGNFLGTSKDAISHIAEQQLRVSRRIDDSLRKLVTLVERNQSPMGGDASSGYPLA